MKRLTIIACCVVILGASYVFGAKTMTHTWEAIDAAITKFLTMDTATELEAMLALENLQGDLSAARVAITDTNENTDETDVEGVINELYTTKESLQTPAGQAEMEAGTETAIRSMSPLRVAQAIAAQVDTSARTVTAHGSVSSGTETFSPGVHSLTVTGSFTWAFDNWPASGTEGVVRAYVTNGGAGTMSWPDNTQFENNIEPSTILPASGESILVITSIDGGTIFKVLIAGEDMQ